MLCDQQQNYVNKNSRDAIAGYLEIECFGVCELSRGSCNDCRSRWKCYTLCAVSGFKSTVLSAGFDEYPIDDADDG